MKITQQAKSKKILIDLNRSKFIELTFPFQSPIIHSKLKFQGTRVDTMGNQYFELKGADYKEFLENSKLIQRFPILLWLKQAL